MSSNTRVRIGGILRFRPLCMVAVMGAPDRPGLAAAIFQALGRERLNTQFIVHSIDANNESHIQFCVDASDVERALTIVRPIAAQLSARHVTTLSGVAVVSVFGPDFRERSGIAGTAFGALAAEGINILAVSTSISTISCVVRASDCDRATDALQRDFDLP
jgi:aspartokinase